jgi:hypothetical protein
MTIDAGNLGRIVTNLRYQSGKDWLLLPAWCKSYIELGIELARYPRTETRFKVALALPTNAFAATFVALGIVLESANQPVVSKVYSEYIRSLPVGTPVIYQSLGRKFRGIIEGFFERDGKTHLTISLGRRQGLQLSLPEHAPRITVADREFKLRNYQQGGKSPSIPALLGATVHDPAAFITQTQLHCLIVALISDFRSEVENTVIGIDLNGRIVWGPVQDILRVEQFLGTNQAYRCQVIASSESPEQSVSSELENPSITVFAGANSYLKHYSKWANAHQIVLLDRTERTFQDAVDNLNENYGRRVDASSARLQFDPPSGVDVMVFEESIQ